MGTKKIPTIENALTIFNNITERATLSNYYYVNKILLSKNSEENSILIVPDDELWNALINSDFKSSMKEIDISDPEEYKLQSLFQYAEDLNKEWIEIDAEKILFPGKVFKISIKGFEYKVSINRDFLPLKLKKAEYCGISYKISTNPNLVLLIKKRFDSPVDGGGFTMIRLFKII